MPSRPAPAGLPRLQCQPHPGLPREVPPHPGCRHSPSNNKRRSDPGPVRPTRDRVRPDSQPRQGPLHSAGQDHPGPATPPLHPDSGGPTSGPGGLGHPPARPREGSAAPPLEARLAAPSLVTSGRWRIVTIYRLNNEGSSRRLLLCPRDKAWSGTTPVLRASRLPRTASPPRPGREAGPRGWGSMTAPFSTSLHRLGTKALFDVQ